MNNKIPIPKEYDEQVMLFEWADLMSARHPELYLLTGSLNGVRLTIGQAVKAKRAGMKKGYPDIHLPVSRGGFHSLYIELKRLKGGRVEPEQKAWHGRLRLEGNKVMVCRGSVEASEVIMDYLSKNILKEVY
uniref:Putative VRR-NUC domain-containing protein n=1 Tax=viral metagenome TaxID=1070528 RepID=A0A6H1ZER9_9ZZZZ